MFNEQDNVKSAVSVFEWHGVICHWKRAWRILEKSPEDELFPLLVHWRSQRGGRLYFRVKHRHFLRVVLALTFTGLGLSLVAEDFQGSSHPLPYDDAIIQYSGQKPNDRVSKLQAQITSGEVQLKWDEQFGWLPAVLDALKIPRSSQMLVFSQTSMQRRAIHPDNPRAIFYTDDVYVGYIPNAPTLEISAVDPKLGGVFYSLDQVRQEKPSFARLSAMSCLGPDDGSAGACHPLVAHRWRRGDYFGHGYGGGDALHSASGSLGWMVCHGPAWGADASWESCGLVGF